MNMPLSPDDRNKGFIPPQPGIDTSGVGSAGGVRSPEAAEEEVKTVSAQRQEGVFTEPLNKNGQANAIGDRNRAFSAFFSNVSSISLPLRLPIQSARTAYASFMDARSVKKEQTTIKAMEKQCELLGIKPDDKASKSNTEVISGLKEQLAAKDKELGNELSRLVGICVKGKYIDESDNGFKVNNSLLRDELSPETLKILEKNKETIPAKDFLKALDELKSAVRQRPALQMIEAEAMTSSLSVNTQGEPKLEEKSIRSLNIKPITEEEVAQFRSSGNAMKDFISCGVGFSAVTLGEETQKIVDNQTNVQVIALNLGSIYKKIDKSEINHSQQSSVSKSLDGALKDLEEVMIKAGEGDINSNSAVGSFAQMDRVLDIAIGAFESNLYNPSLKADLDKEDSKLQHIIQLSKGTTELEAKAEKLKALAASIQAKVEPSTIKVASKTEKDQFQKNLNKIRKDDFDDVDSFAQSMAKDSRDVFLSLISSLDPRLLSNEKVSIELGSYAESLTYSIMDDILKGKNGNEMANSVAFYVKVGKIASKSGDHATAAAIASALTNTSVERLTKGEYSFVRLKNDKKNDQFKQDLAALSALYDPNNNFKEFRKEKNVEVPFMAFVLKDIKFSEEGNLDQNLADGEKLPNAYRGVLNSNALKPLAAAAGLEHGKADNCIGFTSIITQFTGMNMNTVSNEYYARSKGVLSSDEADIRKEKASAKAEERAEKAKAQELKAENKLKRKTI